MGCVAPVGKPQETSELGQRIGDEVPAMIEHPGLQRFGTSHHANHAGLVRAFLGAPTQSATLGSGNRKCLTDLDWVALVEPVRLPQRFDRHPLCFAMPPMVSPLFTTWPGSRRGSATRRPTRA